MAAAGCGGGSLDASTAPLTDGTQVSPQRYLADTNAAASAVTEFSAALADAGPTATKASLRATVNRMIVAEDQARALAERLRAERLEDTRLESQRGRASAALDRVVAAMGAVTTAAAAGDPKAVATAATDFGTAVGALRGLPETG